MFVANFTFVEKSEVPALDIFEGSWILITIGYFVFMGLVFLIMATLIIYLLRKWFALFVCVRIRFSRVADLRRYANGMVRNPAIYSSAPRYAPEADPDNDSHLDAETEEKC